MIRHTALPLGAAVLALASAYDERIDPERGFGVIAQAEMVARCAARLRRPLGPVPSTDRLLALGRRLRRIRAARRAVPRIWEDR